MAETTDKGAAAAATSNGSGKEETAEEPGDNKESGENRDVNVGKEGGKTNTAAITRHKIWEEDFVFPRLEGIDQNERACWMVFWTERIRFLLSLEQRR
jgi:hypothetical protein